MNVPKGLKLLQNLQEPVRQLVVVHEQGLGDSFQFSRFIPGLRKHLKHVVFSSPSKLHGLFKHSGLIDSRFRSRHSRLSMERRDSIHKTDGYH